MCSDRYLSDRPYVPPTDAKSVIRIVCTTSLGKHQSRHAKLPFSQPAPPEVSLTHFVSHYCTVDSIIASGARLLPSKQIQAGFTINNLLVSTFSQSPGSVLVCKSALSQQLVRRKTHAFICYVMCNSHQNCPLIYV